MLKRLLAVLSVLYVLALGFAPPADIIGPKAIQYYDMILLAMVLVVILMGPQPREGNGKPGFPFWGMIVVGGYLFLLIVLTTALFSGLRTGDLGTVYKEITRVLMYILVAFAFAHIAEPAHQKSVRNAVVLSGLILSALILIERFGSVASTRAIVSFYGGSHVDLHFLGMLHGKARGGNPSLGGSFANHNVAASFLLIPFGLVLGRLVSPWQDVVSFWQRWWMALMAIVMAVALFFTQSRAGFMGGTAVVLVAGMLSPVNRKWKARFFAFALLVLVAFFLVQLLSLPVAPNLAGGHIPRSLKISRAFTHKRGSMVIRYSNLWTGMGQISHEGAFWGLGPGRGIQADFELGYAFIWYGPEGLLLYIVMWLMFLLPVWRAPAGFYDRRALVLVITSLVVTAFSHTNFFSTRIFPLFLALYFAEIKWRFWRDALSNRRQVSSDLLVTE